MKGNVKKIQEILSNNYYSKTGLNKAKNIITDINNMTNSTIRKYFLVTYVKTGPYKLKTIIQSYDTTNDTLINNNN